MSNPTMHQLFRNGQSRAATLQDVAELASVSRSTASSILNGSKSSTRTSAATRERVRQAAAKLSYRPNAVARSLRHQATKTIGFYNGFGYIDPRGQFLGGLLAGLHHECDKQAYDLLIHRVSGREDVLSQVQEIICGKVDGVIILTSVGDPLIDILVERRFPSVAIADPHPQIPSVTADDESGSILVAKRLAARGHKRILYRMPPEAHGSSIRRHNSFVDEARKLGMTVVTGISANQIGETSREEVAIINGPEDVRPTAIVCWNDLNAIEAYGYLQVAELTDRFDVIGFDGLYFAGLPMRLTSVYVPWEEVATTAVDIVRKVIAGEPVPLQTFLPVRIVEGDTG